MLKSNQKLYGRLIIMQVISCECPENLMLFICVTLCLVPFGDEVKFLDDQDVINEDKMK